MSCLIRINREVLFCDSSMLCTDIVLQKQTKGHQVWSKDRRHADLNLVFEEGTCLRHGEWLDGWWCKLCKYVVSRLRVFLLLTWDTV
jgi:hypothetical protein